MSVYKRSYRPYTGPVTGTRDQFIALMRYAAAEVWSSRISSVLLVINLVPVLISMVTIYVMNSPTVRALMGMQGGAPLFAIDERFFYQVLMTQCWPALAVTAWIGPRLISTDMSNNALAIILAHPVTRTEYVMAKLAVLAGFLSVVTWIPLLLLFAFQAHMSATPWAASHIRIAVGMFVGSWLWIILLSLISLAVASWVKWRIVATGLLFGFVFVPAGVGTVFNAVMRTQWGSLINIPFMVSVIWRRLVGASIPAFMERFELPTMPMLVSLSLIGFGCALALNARIRAREVVRG